MKKLILPEGFEKDPTYKKPAKTSVTATAKPAGTKQPDNLTVALNKLLDPRRQAERDAEALKNSSKPRSGGVHDPGKAAAASWLAKNAWTLLLWVGGGTVGGALLRMAGKRAWKVKQPKGQSLEDELANIFNQDKMISRWRKSYTFRKDMTYLAKALLDQQFLTLDEYNSLMAQIKGNKLKGMFNEGAKLRNEFKKFAIACVRGNKIRWSSFNRFETFTAAEVEEMIDATIKWKRSMKMNLTAEELAFDKLRTKPVNLQMKQKADGIQYYLDRDPSQVTREERVWLDWYKKNHSSKSLAKTIQATRVFRR